MQMCSFVYILQAKCTKYIHTFKKTPQFHLNTRNVSIL